MLIQTFLGCDSDIIIMFRQEKPKKQTHTYASLSRKFQKVIRQQQLSRLFQTARNASINQIQYQQQQAYQSQLLMNMPYVMPQLPVIDFNWLLQQYLVRSLQPVENQPVQMPLAIQPAQVPASPEPIKQDKRQFQADAMVEMKAEKVEKDVQLYFEKENYRVFKILIGQGSYSRVWEGINSLTGQKIAAKQIKKVEIAQSKCLKRLNSPHIIKVHSIINHRFSTFLILQHCERTLREQMELCDYELEKMLDYFEQMVKGMDVLQKHNFIHRDLKFQNILINNGVLKLADFGLAKYMGDQLEIESRKCGTPYTMAPEIYFSSDPLTQYSSKCDIWSIGILLHQMLYKLHPFGSNKTDFRKKRRVIVKKRFGILDEIIEKCLIFNPEERISWSDFIDLFVKYRNNKNKYLSAELYPIKAERIINQAQPRFEKKINPYEDRAKMEAKMNEIHEFHDEIEKQYSEFQSQRQGSELDRFGSQSREDIKMVESVLYVDKGEQRQETYIKVRKRRFFEYRHPPISRSQYSEACSESQNIPLPPAFIKRKKAGGRLEQLFQSEEQISYEWVCLKDQQEPQRPLRSMQKPLNTPSVEITFVKDEQRRLNSYKSRQRFEYLTCIFFLVVVTVMTMVI